MDTPSQTASPIYPGFSMLEMVGHLAEPGQHGMIVAFMVRGKNHSYQVQWGVSKLEWHLDFELVRLPVQKPKIGFTDRTTSQETHTDCRSPEGITVGLIDGIIAMARTIRKSVKSDPAVTAALVDLRADEDVRWLTQNPDQ